MAGEPLAGKPLGHAGPGSSRMAPAGLEFVPEDFCHCVTAGMFPTIAQFLNHPRKLRSPTLVV